MINRAIDEIRKGNFVIVTDDRSRENEGDLIIAAESITPQAVAFMVRHTSGIVCTPMLSSHLQRLNLPQMVPDNTESHGTAFTVSVDYKFNTETGVSALDRTKTIQALADEKSTGEDFRRPGHIFPLQYREGGVLVRAGHTEAAIDLMRIAGKKPISALSELVCDDGTMMRGKLLEEFAAEHGLHMISVEDLVVYRHQNEKTVVQKSKRDVKTGLGAMQYYEYTSLLDDTSAVALVWGDPATGLPAVRVQTECTANHMLDDLVLEGPSCHCKDNLKKSLQLVSQSKCGVIVILRGIKTASCTRNELSPQIDDHEDDVPTWREIGMGSQILSDLGVHEMNLIISVEKRYPALEGFGLKIVKTTALPEVVLDS